MNGYGIFLMVELARGMGLISKELEYDLIWEQATGYYTEFEASTFNDENSGEYDCISRFLDTKKVIPEYTLGENNINGTSINKKIQREELHEYEIRDREDFIDTLIEWIGEARGSDKVLMREDLELLLDVEDDYILSSNSTNSYLYQGCSEFEETCKELLELNLEFK